eukprot:348025_1
MLPQLFLQFKMTSSSASNLLNKSKRPNIKQIQVISNQNYGAMDNLADCGPFGRSPPLANAPSPNREIQHNQHLSNLPHSMSTPNLTLKSPSKSSRDRMRAVYNATIASPYFRTLSPRVHSVQGSVESYPITTPEGVRAISATGSKKLVTVWGAGFSIINLFLGLGLLSFPYALAEGSFTSLAVLAMTCFLMSYTGKLIVRCFEGVPPEERTYHQVGYIALNETLSFGKRKLKWGNFGMGLITFGILCEFVGALCMSAIFIWDNVSYLVPDLNFLWIIIISTCAVLPTCWMLNVSELAFNAFLGCVCKVFTVVVIVITFFLDTSVTERTEYDVVPQSPTRFSVSVGIFILSYAGHACLPEIYTSMKEPERFERVLDICFVIMFFTYSGMALFGYLQYGKATAVIITENLVTGESTNKAQLYVAKALIGFVIASCYFQVSPILSVVANIPEDFLSIRTPMKKRVFRTCLFGGIVVMSWAVLQHLAILEAVTGSLCTMITSVICPALFYYGLNRKTVSMAETIVLFSYFICGVLLGLYLLYNDIIAVLTGQQ